MDWDGDAYQARFDALAAEGKDVHGEATFVEQLLGAGSGASVIDAGCGSGRVAIELHRRGFEVTGVDRDPSMLSAARRATPEVEWVDADLASFDLGITVDCVVMAGNVLLFVTPGTEAAVVRACGRHLRRGGRLVAGFQLRPGGYDLDRLDADGDAAGLRLDDRYATWDRDPFVPRPAAEYAVSVFTRFSRTPEG